MNWLKKTLTPGVREAQDEDTIEAAKRRLAQEGNLGVFDQVEPEARLKGPTMIVKNKSDHVRLLVLPPLDSFC